jgi:glutathione S-transferase
MSLILYMHPLSSFCQKVLIALYENGVPFIPRIVDLGDPAQRAELTRLWPLCKFPVIRDEARGLTIPETTVIIEYLGHHYRGPVQLIPPDPEAALKVRQVDRFYDLYVNETVGRIVSDRLRAAGDRDATGVATARRQLLTALAMAENALATHPWAAGDAFSMADCAAAPTLFYADRITPLAGDYPHVRAYLDRLMQRPSYARVLTEATPYLHLFPVDAAGDHDHAAAQLVPGQRGGQP